MSTNSDFNINWELALHDVKNIVCKHLDLEGLCNLANVSKSWRDAALYEANKRCYIQHMRLPYEFDHPTLNNMLHNFRTSLIIYDSKFARPYYAPSKASFNNPSNLFKKKLLSHLKNKLPGKTVLLIRTSKCLTTEDVEPQGVEDQHEVKLKKYDIHGLFFPSIENRASIKMVGIQNQLCNSCSIRWFSKSFDLHLNERPKSTILIFIGSTEGYKIAQRVLKKVKARNSDRKETIWAGVFTNKLNAFGTQFQRSHLTPRSILAVRITGPSVQSWSMMINACLPLELIESKLYELKQKVKPGRYCSGLLYGPVLYCGSHEIMSSIKKIFSGIPFMGLFNTEDSLYLTKKFASYIDPDIQLPDLDEVRDRSRYMSLIIISYD